MSNNSSENQATIPTITPIAKAIDAPAPSPTNPIPKSAAVAADHVTNNVGFKIETLNPSAKARAWRGLDVFSRPTVNSRRVSTIPTPMNKKPITALEANKMEG